MKNNLNNILKNNDYEINNNYPCSGSMYTVNRL